MLHLTDRRGFLTRTVLGRAEGAAAGLVRALCVPFAPLYGLGARASSTLYAAGLRRSACLPGPTISVGNLSVGGTGKTPMVQWVARRLLEMGRRPAVLSRGYGAKADDGGAMNDEAAMLSQTEPDIVHRCSPNRVAAAKRAAEEDGANCFVLDDGFQHRRVKRDLDIVLLDASAPRRSLHPLPWGQLREPFAALGRADVVVLTHVDQCAPEELGALEARVRRVTDAPIAHAEHQPAGVSGSEPEELRGRKAYAFCGIGNPESFVATLDALGAEVVGATFFPDHFAYSRSDVDGIVAEGKALGAELLATTEKDAVKLKDSVCDERLRVVRIEMMLTQGEAMLRERIAGALRETARD